MSVRVMSWVFESAPCTGNDRLVLLAIADEADDDGGSAFPSIDRLASKARLPKRTVMRCLERLEASGELVIYRPEKPGRGHHNRYRVVVENLPPDPVENPEKKGDSVAPVPSIKGAERRAAVPDRSRTHRPVTTTTRRGPGLPVENPTEATVRAARRRADEADRRAAEERAIAPASPVVAARAMAEARARLGRVAG